MFDHIPLYCNYYKVLHDQLLAWQKYIADVHLVQMTFIFSPSYMHYSYAGIQPCSVLSTITISVTSTILQTMEPTSRPSMTPGEGDQQDNCSDTIAAVVTMGVFNIIFIAIIVTLVIALMRCRKKQVQGSADVQRGSTIGLFHLMSLPPPNTHTHRWTACDKSLQNMLTPCTVQFI